jgi:hypothetical protein
VVLMRVGILGDGHGEGSQAAARAQHEENTPVTPNYTALVAV